MNHGTDKNIPRKTVPDAIEFDQLAGLCLGAPLELHCSADPCHTGFEHLRVGPCLESGFVNRHCGLQLIGLQLRDLCQIIRIKISLLIQGGLAAVLLHNGLGLRIPGNPLDRGKLGSGINFALKLH